MVSAHYLSGSRLRKNNRPPGEPGGQSANKGYPEMSIERYEAAVLAQQRLVRLFKKGVTLGCDEPSWLGHLNYREPYAMRNEPDEIRRDAALSWLRKQLPVLHLIAGEFGTTVEKVADEHCFGLKVAIYDEHETLIEVVRALVDAELTCEIVPTGELKTIPAQPEQTVEVTKRVCPPSIFAGIEREAINA